MVPKPIQRAVWRAYRPGQCDDKRPSEAWHQAADAAIGFIARLEGQPVRPAEAEALEVFEKESNMKESNMKVRKVVERTRQVVVEVEADGVVFIAKVSDHFNSEVPGNVFAGDTVYLKRGEESGVVVAIPIKWWSLVCEAIDRAISEFKAAYPESPQ
jgi:hypothetical protein